MAYVIDSTGRVSPTAMRNMGIVGTVRYVAAGSSWKHATYSEIHAYLSAGLSVAFVSEGGTGMATGSYSAGNAAAKAGLAAASNVLGHPARMIYLACDTDTSFASTANFYRGARDGVGASKLGVYGPRRVCAGVLDAGYAKYAWQPEAWSVGVDPRVQLHQHTKYVTVGGVQCDYNEIRHADWGQNPYTSATPVPPVKPATPYAGEWIRNAESYFHMVG